MVNSFFEFLAWSKGGYALGRHLDLFTRFLRVVRFPCVAIAALESTESNEGYAITFRYHFGNYIGKCGEHFFYCFFRVVCTTGDFGSQFCFIHLDSSCPNWFVNHVIGKDTALRNLKQVIEHKNCGS